MFVFKERASDIVVVSDVSREVMSPRICKKHCLVSVIYLPALKLERMKTLILGESALVIVVVSLVRREVTSPRSRELALASSHQI